MKAPRDCQQPAYHEMHRCILQHLNEDESSKLATDPQFRCLRCNLQANLAKNLCQPKKL